MTQEERFKIISNDYFDLVIKYNNNLHILQQYEKYSVQPMNEAYAVIYMPIAEVSTHNLTDFGYSAVPNTYALLDEQSLDASGITQLRNVQTINLRGKGVIIGIIDTGIDYTNPVFQHTDGTTRILAIWDQTIDSDNYPVIMDPVYYGTEYTADQINQALKIANPLEIVPSTDENGHGTMLAGIAAGSEDEKKNFSGVAPDADLIIVKLKEAKKNLKDLYFIPDNVSCYQENDIIWAIGYMLGVARRRFNRPVSICIGLGTSLGAHNNNGLLNTIVSIAADIPRVAISVAAGNEGSARRHFYSEIAPGGNPVPVELNIGENEYGFTMELWGDPPMIYNLDIQSPSGESKSKISERFVETQTIRFVFDPTIIYINFVLIEQDTGKQVIILRFQKPSPGTWKFNVYGKGDIAGAFHIWLPVDNFISKNTYFINPNPNTTITSPGNCFVPITVTAYNSNSGILYSNSSKGFSTSNIISPDLAAPGVNISCPGLKHTFTTMTGTSAAAAHMTGIAAMLQEWCIVDNNYPDVDTNGLRKFLMRGAKRSSNLKYPNPDWGYGIVDVYNTFNIFRTDVR